MTAAGLLSTELSIAGVSGCEDVFEGQYGYFNIYWNGAYLREELTRDLGHHFEGVNTSFKPYPCCRYTHGAIDAALAGLRTYGISSSSVEKVEVHVTTQKFFDAVSRPLVLTDNPTMDGQFSIPYTVASALIDGYVFLDSFDPATVKEQKRIDFARKVTVFSDLPVLDPKSLGPVSMDIFASGGVHKLVVQQPKGSPGNPLSWDECVTKFRRCCLHAGPAISGEKQNRLIDMVANLESIQNVTTIMECMV
jgi:2-methylcitrate dehydratase PrpD